MFRSQIHIQIPKFSKKKSFKNDMTQLLYILTIKLIEYYRKEGNQWNK